MASLSKNGDELARVNELTRSFSYRSNGYILMSYGDGWRRYNKRPYADIKERAKYATWFDAELGKGYQEYRQLFHDTIPLRNRLHAAEMIKLYKGDPDALFSEFDDRGWDVTHADAVQLADVYNQYRVSLDSEPFAVEIKYADQALYTMVGVVVGDLHYRKQVGDNMVLAKSGDGGPHGYPAKSRRCLTTPRLVRTAVTAGRGTFEVARQHPEYDRLTTEGFK
ncbi:MAG: hypothetical protein B7Z37_26600 [Verrucomicrobia bacterium 12-59-8]|nr:MAG: hypothetical protein B7Z37_26600 [Verrucomicrobia bacterium 12-59-8]